MQEKLLLKCDNTIFADEIASLLYENGIASRQHDESQDTAVGAYGAVTGVAVFVFKRDYDEALALITPLVEARNNAKPICPKCGSDNVDSLAKNFRSGLAFTVSCLLMILLPIVYFVLPAVFDHRSQVADIVALILFFAGWLVLFLGRHANDNYRCRECGKSFQHL